MQPGRYVDCKDCALSWSPKNQEKNLFKMHLKVKRDDSRHPNLETRQNPFLNLIDINSAKPEPSIVQIKIKNEGMLNCYFKCKLLLLMTITNT